MKDKKNCQTLKVNVIQDTTSFNKNNLGTIKGTIQTSKTKFAGSWNGTFNFNISLIKSN